VSGGIERMEREQSNKNFKKKEEIKRVDKGCANR